MFFIQIACFHISFKNFLSLPLRALYGEKSYGDVFLWYFAQVSTTAIFYISTLLNKVESRYTSCLYSSIGTRTRDFQIANSKSPAMEKLLQRDGIKVNIQMVIYDGQFSVVKCFSNTAVACLLGYLKRRNFSLEIFR